MRLNPLRRIYRSREVEVTLVEDAYDVLGAVNRPGMSETPVLGKGWGRVRWFIEEVPF